MPHTPGPWTLNNGALLQDSGRKLHIGTFNEAPGLGHAATANARLIAAAPDLLAALQKLVRAIDRLPGNNPLDGLADEARAAIRAATGQD